MTEYAKAPQTLNGFPVKAVRWIDATRCTVCVLREGHRDNWIVAQWWPELGDTWQWGHYGNSWEWADDLASKIAAEYRKAKP